MNDGEKGLTQGGINVFSWSVGLDTPINDVDLNPVPGRAVVAIICAECGHAPIGKVLVNRERAWLNCYGAPHSDDYSSRRPQGSSRIPAPRIVLTHLLQGPGYQCPSLWCEKHGEKDISGPAIYAAMNREAITGKVVRLAV